MASTFDYFLLLCSLLIIIFVISSSEAETPFAPKALVLPITKESSHFQYYTRISQRTPPVPLKLTVDLGGAFLWTVCDQGSYMSSSYRPATCGSAQCSLANSRGCVEEIYPECYNTPNTPGCYNNTCYDFPDNRVAQRDFLGEIGQDIVYVQSTNGINPGGVVSVPGFISSCALTFLLRGLKGGVNGMAGLGRTNISLPSQFSTAFGFPRKFAICLSSTTKSNGVLFFGNGPYVLLPNNIDVSKSLVYTPLIVNPKSTATGLFGDLPSSDYFIDVKAIKVNGKAVEFDTTLLSINEIGYGGTKISTINQYTVMDTSIYKVVVEAFINVVGNNTRVAPVSPFGACFSSEKSGYTWTRPAVPPIDLVFQEESVYWRIFGANSMVHVNKKVTCLGFIDGGIRPRTSIIIGGHQIEDNLLEFDLAASRLGFRSSLLFQQTTCSNFNFTSVSL